MKYYRKNKSGKKIYRVLVELTEDEVLILNKLQQSTGSRSRREVVSRLLRGTAGVKDDATLTRGPLWARKEP